MQTLRRRASDEREGRERRRAWRDRRSPAPVAEQIRFPGRKEQAVQFLTRYLFAVLGLVFFNYSPDLAPILMPLWQVNTLLSAHILINTINFAHAWREPYSPRRFQFAMWVDLVVVSVCVVNDPYDIPPSLVAFIMVVLGNGMRYGMRFFAEALVGALLGAALSLGVRYAALPHGLSPGMLFLSLFGAIILLYAYLLMSRIESSREQTEQHSRTDMLTGLMNRRGLFESAEQLLAGNRQRGLVVLFADLDKFKAINDKHGHAEGDRVLRELSDVLKTNVRASDVAARYGGDEFVVLLTDIVADSAEGAARRIQERIRSWAVSTGIDCGATIGLGVVPPDEHNFGAVLASVDRALYESKCGGDGGLRRVEIAQPA